MEANNVSSVDTAEVAQATSYLKRTEDILQAEFSDLLPKDLFPDTFVSLQNRPKDLGNAACPEVALFGHGKDKD